MNEIFDNWKNALNDFKQNIEKDILEIRRHKEEVRQMRDQMKNELSLGRFIRDDDCLILSAPKIIIGNVDKSGELIAEGMSQVILRGNAIELQGVGIGGSIVSKAPLIQQTAVNPGTDGRENVVEGVSRIVSLASSVSIKASDDENIFVEETADVHGGVSIAAETEILLNAAVAGKSKLNLIDSRLATLNALKTTYQTNVDDIKTSFENLLVDMDNYLQKFDDLVNDSITARTSIADIFEINNEFKEKTAQTYALFCIYSQTLSELAEVTREINKLKDNRYYTQGNDDINKSKGCNVKIIGEKIDLSSRDGEGNLMNSPGSGIRLLANNINLSSENGKGELEKDGEILISAENINVSTLNRKNIEFDSNGQLTKGKFDAEGCFRVQSKQMVFESVDYEIENKRVKRIGLAKEGKIIERAEKIGFTTNDEEGKAVGLISLNSKAIDLKTMDVEKETGKDKNIAEGSSVLLQTEKIYIGNIEQDDKMTSKNIQIAAKGIVGFGIDSIGLQQYEKDAHIQIKDEKIDISAKEVGIYGETTIGGKTTFKTELHGPKGVFDNLEVKTHFQSPNISEGMGGGSGKAEALKKKLELSKKRELNIGDIKEDLDFD